MFSKSHAGSNLQTARFCESMALPQLAAPISNILGIQVAASIVHALRCLNHFLLFPLALCLCFDFLILPSSAELGADSSAGRLRPSTDFSSALARSSAIFSASLLLRALLSLLEDS